MPLRPWLLPTIIAAVCLTVYANTLVMGFVWVDFEHVTGNPLIRSLANLPIFFVHDVWYGIPGDHISHYYRPLFNVSLALDYLIWGENPIGYHLTNAILHTLATLSLFSMACRILQSRTASGAAALLFAVHPVHAEAVSYIASRAEPLCSLFVFTSLALYFRYRDTCRWKDLVYALIFACGALLTKETAIILPALIVLSEACFGAKGLWWPRWRGALSFWLLIPPYLLIRQAAIIPEGETLPPLVMRLVTAPLIYVSYLKNLFLPLDLKLHYVVPLQRGFSAQVLVAISLLLFLLVITVMTARKNRLPFFCLAWFLGGLLPVIGIIAIVKPSPMADRYLYLPSAAFALLAGWGFVHFLTAVRGASLTGVAGHKRLQFAHLVEAGGIALLICLLVLNIVRNCNWHDNIHFMERRIQDAPRFAMGHALLAKAYLDADRLTDAERALAGARALNRRIPYAEMIMGLLRERQGDLLSAEHHLFAAQRLAPYSAQLKDELARVRSARRKLVGNP